MLDVKKGMKVYIAAPFFDKVQVNVVKRIEEVLHKAGIEYFSPRSEGTLIEMNTEERAKKMNDIFQSNVAHMDWSTHCVAFIDGYDKGTVWEMGYMFAKGKKIITFTNSYYGINVMLNESIEAHCVEFDEILEGLKGIFKGVKTIEVI